MKKEEHVIQTIVKGPGMSPNDYQKSVVDNAFKEGSGTTFINGILGLGAEIGKCHNFYRNWLSDDNYHFDKPEIAITLGEMSRYLATIARAIGYDLEDIFRISLENLEDRCTDTDA